MGLLKITTCLEMQGEYCGTLCFPEFIYAILEQPRIIMCMVLDKEFEDLDSRSSS